MASLADEDKLPLVIFTDGHCRESSLNQWVHGTYQRPEAMLIYFSEHTTSGTAAVIVITTD